MLRFERRWKRLQSFQYGRGRFCNLVIPLYSTGLNAGATADQLLLLNDFGSSGPRDFARLGSRLILPLSTHALLEQ